MCRVLFVPLVAVALASSVTAHAQDHMEHQKHMALMAGDASQLVNFPPQMRQHTLSNMRDHMQSLAEILAALSRAQYTEAAQIAEARLGINSPAADGCKVESATSAPLMSKAPSMELMMSLSMPEGMRAIGLQMHQAASAFVLEARQAAATGDAKPALAALSRVAAQCTACHSSYRIQ